MKRAERRAARERMKSRAARVYPDQNPGKYADHMAVCSCPMCCNVRRNGWLKSHERLTPNERWSIEHLRRYANEDTQLGWTSE